MARPAHAREAILKSAEDIVKDIGAANLTFDELVRRSGFTRGGITYHFPTKDALLQALIAHDLAAWTDCLARKRELHGGPNRDLLAYIDSGSEPDEDASRLCAGLLSATTSAKELDDPWRAYFARHHSVVQRSGDPELAAILSLAVDGLFWLETLGLSALKPRQRQRVVRRMLDMARAIPAPSQAAAR